jgi:hypothetical protein
MKTILFTLISAIVIPGFAKTTGQKYTNLQSRLIDSKYCVVIGSFTSQYSASGRARTAFLVSPEFCKSKAASQMLATINQAWMEVFISSGTPVNTNSKAFEVIHAKTGVSWIETKDLVLLVSEMKEVIEEASRLNPDPWGH